MEKVMRGQWRNTLTMSAKDVGVNRRSTILMLTLTILIGAILRVYDIGTESIWNDEVSGIFLSTKDITKIIKYAGPTQSNPPLYFIILHYWIGLFGMSEGATRSLSAIFGIISILLIYQVGVLLFNTRVGLLSSFLSSISIFHIHYSQEARGYSLLLLLSLLSYLFFIKILEEDKKGDYLYYFITNTVLGYTHFYGLIIIASQVFFFVFFWGKYRFKRIKFLITLAGIIIALLPLALILRKRMKWLVKAGFWLTEPDFLSIIYTLKTFSGDGLGSPILLLMFLILLLIGFVSFTKLGGKWVWKSPLKSLKNFTIAIKFNSIEKQLLLVMWLSFSIIIPFIESKFMTPIYLTRYMIGASPAFLLLVAKGMSTITKKKILYSTLIFVILLSGLGLRDYYVNFIHPQWREVVSFVKIHCKEESDVAIISPSVDQIAFDYYYKGELKRVGMNHHLSGIEEISNFVNDASREKVRVWLIFTQDIRRINIFGPYCCVMPRPNREEISRKNTELVGYLMNRYGNKAIQLDKQFFRIQVLLLNLSTP